MVSRYRPACLLWSYVGNDCSSWAPATDHWGDPPGKSFFFLTRKHGGIFPWLCEFTGGYLRMEDELDFDLPGWKGSMSGKKPPSQPQIRKRQKQTGANWGVPWLGDELSETARNLLLLTIGFGGLARSSEADLYVKSLHWVIHFF